MNIIRKDIDAVNATLTVQISKDDYVGKVERSLKEMKHKANLPGFRPGMVPVGLLRKMYGKAVTAEEVNKVMEEALNKYINENNINLLGELLPNETEQKPVDFDTQEDLEFIFDMGIVPEFGLTLSKKDKIDWYDISVDDKVIDDQIHIYQERMGKSIIADAVDENDFIKGGLNEVTGEEQEPGIMVENAQLIPSYIDDEQQRALFIGKKIGDTVTFNPSKAYNNEAEIASLLKIDKEKVKTVVADFEFTIKEISRFQKHELDQELFDAVYGTDAVKNEEEFRAKVVEELKKTAENNSFYRFMKDARPVLLKKIADVVFPEEFLKRWILATSKVKPTPQMLDEQFTSMLDALKWQLVCNKIMKDNSLSVEIEDIEAYAKDLLKAQYAQYGITTFPDDLLTQYVNEILKKEETVKQYSHNVLEEKVIDTVKHAVKLNRKEISYEEFRQLK